jgi:hypothetical protein
MAIYELPTAKGSSVAIFKLDGESQSLGKGRSGTTRNANVLQVVGVKGKGQAVCSGQQHGVILRGRDQRWLEIRLEIPKNPRAIVREVYID